MHDACETIPVTAYIAVLLAVVALVLTVYLEKGAVQFKGAVWWAWPLGLTGCTGEWARQYFLKRGNRNAATLSILGSVLLCFVFGLTGLFLAFIKSTATPLRGEAEQTPVRKLAKKRHAKIPVATPQALSETELRPRHVVTAPQNSKVTSRRPVTVVPTLAPNTPSPTATPYLQSLLDVRVSGAPNDPDHTYMFVRYGGPGKVEDLCIWFIPLLSRSENVTMNVTPENVIATRYTLWTGGVQNTSTLGAYEHQLYRIPSNAPAPAVSDVYVFTSYTDSQGRRIPHEDAFGAFNSGFIPETPSVLLSRSEFRRIGTQLCKSTQE